MQTIAATVSMQILCSWCLEFFSTDNKTCDVANILPVDCLILQHKELSSVQMNKATQEPAIQFACTEAVAQRCSVKKVLLEISQSSQENIKNFKRGSTLLKKRLWHRCFSVNFAKFRRTPFFTEHLRWLLLHVNLHKCHDNILM